MHWRKSQLINGTVRGWLEASPPLPDDETIAAALGSPRKASSTISTLASPVRSAAYAVRVRRTLAARA